MVTVVAVGVADCNVVKSSFKKFKLPFKKWWLHVTKLRLN